MTWFKRILDILAAIAWAYVARNKDKVKTETLNEVERDSLNERDSIRKTVADISGNPNDDDKWLLNPKERGES